MEAVFNIWETSRKSFLGFFDNYSLDQLNKIPKGFSNNLIWNIGHLIVVQQALVYVNSNLEATVPTKLFALYKPGTKPTENTSQEEVDELKTLLISPIEKTKTDFKNSKFSTYQEKTVGTAFHLTTVKDAFLFNNYHEGLHLGYMTNIKKFV